MNHSFHARYSPFKKLCEEFTRVKHFAYKHTFLICNQFLSGTPFSSAIYDKYQTHQDAAVKYASIPWKIFAYFSHSLYLYFLYLTGALLTKSRYPLRKNILHTDNTVLIDNYFILHDIVKADKYNEKYFNGLPEILDKRNISYVFIPKLFGIENPVTLYLAFNVLRDTQINALLEFHVLTANDYLKIFIFILTYPFKTLSFALRLDGNTYEKRLIRQGLIDSLDKPTFLAFSRYLFGVRLGGLELSHTKCISWFENQEIDKAFLKGLRTGGSKARIFGCQLFVWAPTLFHIHIDSSDIAAGLAPDKVLVSGEIYLRSSEKVPFELGPSFRYAKLFCTKKDSTSSGHILVLLSYYVEECRELITILKDERFASENMYFRFHPSTNPAQLSSILPPGYKIAEGDLYSWLKSAKIVIGAETGSLIEAACLGVPAIHINTRTRLIHNNPLPTYGKGTIWECAHNAEEVFVLLSRLTAQASNDPQGTEKLAREYMRLFFTQPTEAAIVKAFEL